MIVVPEAFAARTIRRSGEAGRRWVEGLPRQLDCLCTEWELETLGPPRFGEWGLVYDVSGAGTPAVLKLSWPDDGGAFERAVAALSLWDGRGAALPLRADAARRALLLERLGPASLQGVGIGEALEVAGYLLRRSAVPAPAGFPRLSGVAEDIAATLPERWERQGRPLPGEVLARAVRLARELAPSAASLVVNWDLHYDNVLRGRREPWLAIDPQLLAGDPEYGVAQLLWWRLEAIEAQETREQGGVPWALGRLVASAELDAGRARAWTYVRTVDYWLMALEGGLTLDPPRCERVVAALHAAL